MVRAFARSGLLIAALAALGACAPITFAPAGLNLSSGYGMPWSSLSQCSMLGASSPEAARMGVRTPAMQAGAIRNRVHQLQFNSRVGFSAGQTLSSWKRVASGEC